MSQSSPEGIILGKGSTLISAKLIVDEKVVLDLKSKERMYNEEELQQKIDAHLEVAKDLWLSAIKEQKRMYSEEEVLELLKKFAPHIRYNYKELPHTWSKVVKEWFEQFKKEVI